MEYSGRKERRDTSKQGEDRRAKFKKGYEKYCSENKLDSNNIASRIIAYRKINLGNGYSQRTPEFNQYAVGYLIIMGTDRTSNKWKVGATSEFERMRARHK